MVFCVHWTLSIRDSKRQSARGTANTLGKYSISASGKSNACFFGGNKSSWSGFTFFRAGVETRKTSSLRGPTTQRFDPFPRSPNRRLAQGWLDRLAVFRRPPESRHEENLFRVVARDHAFRRVDRKRIRHPAGSRSILPFRSRRKAASVHWRRFLSLVFSPRNAGRLPVALVPSRFDKARSFHWQMD